MKNLLLLFFAIVLSSGQLLAQTKQYEKRIESDSKDGYVNDTVIQFGKRGLIVQAEKRAKTEGKRVWRFKKVDKDLNKRDMQKISLEKQYYPDRSTLSENRYFVFYEGRKGRYVLGNIGIDEMKFQEVRGKLPKRTIIKDMVVMGDYAFLQAKIRKETVLFAINWKTGERKFLPLFIEGYHPKKISAENIQVLKNGKELLLHIVAVDSKKKMNVFLFKFDDKADLISTIDLSKEIDKNIEEISSTKITDGKYICTGTYSEKKLSNSQGIFISQISDNKVDFIEYHSFFDLKEFLSYLPERKEKRIKKRHKRKRAKGKNIGKSYRIADHDIITLSDGYLFIGEAFYSTSFCTTLSSGVNGVSITTCSFAGYEYTHAVIVKFDKNGKLLWDTSFDMTQTYKPFYVKRFITVSESDEQGIRLVFSSGKNINSKYIDYKGMLEKEELKEEIETAFESDKTKWALSDISYWYDDYFIVFGEQKIKNKEGKTSKKKRKVQFINKVKY